VSTLYGREGGGEGRNHHLEFARSELPRVRGHRTGDRQQPQLPRGGESVRSSRFAKTVNRRREQGLPGYAEPMHAAGVSRAKGCGVST